MTGEHILVVEDEHVVRELVEEMLADAGFAVTTASSPGDALGLVDDRGVRPALVVTDVVMPGMSGPELAAELLARQPELRVLYISGYADEAIARRGGSLDNGAFLAKPFSGSQLVGAVRDLLDGRA